MKAVENALRDVLVVRCKSRVASNDRAGFIAEARKAFGQEWSKQHESQTLLAVSKVYGKKANFLSNCALATAHRGGRRRPAKRNRDVPGPQKTNSGETEEAGGEEGETET